MRVALPQAQDVDKPNSEALLHDVIQWDIFTWSKALTFWEQVVDWTQVDNCLELGGRDGGLSLWLARKNKSVVFSDVVDLSAPARELHKKYGVDTRIEYRVIDATDIPYESRFDIIILKSTLGAIERQQDAFDQIHKALKPGGYLLFAENLRGSILHRFARRRVRHWGNNWHYMTVPEMKQLLQHFGSWQIKTTGLLSVFGQSDRQKRMLSRIDNAIERVTPASWHYMVYGIAQKQKVAVSPDAVGAV